MEIKGRVWRCVECAILASARGRGGLLGDSSLESSRSKLEGLGTPEPASGRILAE